MTQKKQTKQTSMSKKTKKTTVKKAKAWGSSKMRGAGRGWNK